MGKSSVWQCIAVSSGRVCFRKLLVLCLIFYFVNFDQTGNGSKTKSSSKAWKQVEAK
jgi:hypothetical protein